MHCCFCQLFCFLPAPPQQPPCKVGWLEDHEWPNGFASLPDVQQTLIGSCQPEDVAVRVWTRVIGHYPDRNQLLVDCGWTGLSLHSLGQLPTGFALVDGHPDLKLVGMTQEHGKIEPVTGELDFAKFPLGSLLALIPYHACATAAMHPVFFVHSGGRVVETWKPVRGW
ncbi:hypothetical protein E2320_001487 [Naja naja]|nr:hypothetical protein E2320_001487 [Naja naja]